MRLILSAFALLGLGHEAFACRVPVFMMRDNVVVPATMSVASGKPCGIRYHPLDGMTIALQRRPRNGTVSVDGHGYISYRSRPGFVGTDRFDFARSGYDDFRVKVIRRVSVQVTVTP